MSSPGATGENEHKAGGVRVWMLVCEGLIASVNLGFGVPAGDAFQICMGVIWLFFFCFSLRRFRRTRSKQAAMPVP
ncbi:MAG TPA: hypothetical protein VG816_01320 [Solirubrobacterales bacterium]|nr:hypothetical protein [Solirubrobacterales bacterium]